MERLRLKATAEIFNLRPRAVEMTYLKPIIFHKFIKSITTSCWVHMNIHTSPDDSQKSWCAFQMDLCSSLSEVSNNFYLTFPVLGFSSVYARLNTERNVLGSFLTCSVRDMDTWPCRGLLEVENGLRFSWVPHAEKKNVFLPTGTTHMKKSLAYANTNTLN